MATTDTVAEIEGPKGSAKIVEVWDNGRLIEYRVEADGETTTCENLGDAYMVAGEKVGKRV